eukprot:4688197-Pleurochrysis_carterae.AAC.1
MPSNPMRRSTAEHARCETRYEQLRKALIEAWPTMRDLPIRHAEPCTEGCSALAISQYPVHFDPAARIPAPCQAFPTDFDLVPAQELVRAFEALSSPEPPPAAETGKRAKAQGPALARSNANCFRTRVFCPRCSAEWATADAGVE